MTKKKKHELIGQFASIVAEVAKSFLNEVQYEQLSSIKLDEWIDAPIVCLAIDKIGEQDPGKARTIGRSFSYSLKQDYLDRGVDNPFDAMRAMTELYQTVNRGDDIGGFEILDEGENFIECSDTTPYNCDFTEGIILGVVRNFKGKNVETQQTTCRRNGDPMCVYRTTWE